MSRRVAFFADSIAHWSAGTERQLLLLGTELVKRGWSVPLYVLKRSAAVRDGSWPDEVISLDAGRVASPTTWWRVLQACRGEVRNGAMVAHCFFNDSSIVVPPMSRIAGLPAIVSRRDMGFWYTKGVLAALRIVRRYVAGVIANCEAVRSNVIREEGYSERDVEVIYNGLVDIDLPPRHLEYDRTVIGIVANIRPIKRIDDAIRAFSSVSNDFPTAVLRIVGGGDTSHLRDLSKELGVSNRVEFSGPSENSSHEIAMFSVAMLTSESEGLSNAIIEYMLAGVPVVCTNTGGNPELIVHNVTGLLADVGDLGGLENCLRRLLADKDVRLAMGDAAKARILAMCSTDLMVSSHIALYEQVAA